jgi:dTDP-4-amino-4,6-dideoxygalactose transaminase
VDYAGHPCDWEALRSIADRYELQLVNDNCHALGASYNGDTQYAVKYADVVTQSFHPVKHITTGEGGAILSNIAQIDEKVRLLRIHGMTKNLNLMEKNDGPWYYEMMELGYNYRITDFQCSLGISQLQKLAKFVKSRRKIARLYNQAFGDGDHFVVPAVPDNVEHAYHLYPLQIQFDEINMNRNELFIKMEGKGIRLQVHYIPVHFQPYYMKKFGFKEGDFPVSEKFYWREVSLPMYPALTIDDQQIVIKSLGDIPDG